LLTFITRIRKYVAIVVLFVLVTQAVPYNAKAASYFAGGNGTVTNPYIIETEVQLKLIDSFPDASFKLRNDIILSNYWTPLGLSKAFSGSIDGNGYTIINLSVIDSFTYLNAGLFGSINGGTIKNLKVITSTQFGVNSTCATGSNNTYAGVLVGSITNGTLINCSVSGKVNLKNSTSSDGYCGGLVGYSKQSTIEACSSVASVNVDITGNAYVGGLIGYDESIINNCSANGNVTVTTRQNNNTTNNYIGGLVGKISGSDYSNSVASLSGSFATGNCQITSRATDLYCGGLVGYNYYRSISNCYATGSIDSNHYAANPNIGYCLGGLIGYSNYKVRDSYAIGDINGYGSSTYGQYHGYAGGLIGYTYESTANCFATGNINGTVITNANYDTAVCASGGLLGTVFASTISNSYAIGNATSSANVNVPNSTAYSYAGGFIGYSQGGTVTCCYSAGKPTAAWKGGLIGMTTNGGGSQGAVINSYYNTTTSGLFDTNKGLPLASDNMKSSLYYSTWDFKSIWKLDPNINSGYPSFRMKSINLKETSIDLYEGESYNLLYNILPITTHDQEIEWVSSDDNIITVTNGIITAKKSGVASVLISPIMKDTVAVCIINVLPTSDSKVGSPIFTFPSGEVPRGSEIELSTNTTGADIYYTVDGSAPTISSIKYVDHITLTKDLTIRAIAMKRGMKNSNEVSVNYTVIDPYEYVKDPLANYSSGQVYIGTAIKLSSITKGAKLFYTLDGTSPTTSSMLYNGDIIINKDTILSVIAIKSGMLDSKKVIYTYKAIPKPEKVQVPVSSLPSGTIKANTSVTLTSNTAGSSIYYTTDGSTPTTASSQYIKPIIITKDTILKAIAVKNGMENSNIAIFQYKVQVINVTKINLNKTSLTMNKGTRFRLIASKYPTNAVNTIKWTTSSNKVVTVDANGNILAVGKGTATITVTASNGIKNSCTIKVLIPATSIKLNNSSITLQKGKTYQLKSTITTGSTDSVTWQSSNKLIASVDKFGKIKGIKKGKVTITAKTTSGKIAKCTVTIK